MHCCSVPSISVSNPVKKLDRGSNRSLPLLLFYDLKFVAGVILSLFFNNVGLCSSQAGSMLLLFCLMCERQGRQPQANRPD